MALRIVKRQTTYWDFGDEGRSFRIHFLGKQEQRFSQEAVPSFEIVSDHLVLMEYRFRWDSLYVSSASREPESLLRGLLASLNQGLLPWRDAAGYFNNLSGPLAVLRSGYGFLFRGPEPLAEKLGGLLAESRIEFLRIPGPEADWPMQALIAGENFVVAREFRIAD